MLSNLLQKHNISAAKLGRHIVQTGGRKSGCGLSAASMSRLLKGEYPKSTPKNILERQIVEFFLARGIPAEEMTGLGTAATAAPANETEPHTQIPGSHTTQETHMLPDAQRLSSQAKKHFRLKRDPFQDDISEEDDIFLSASQYDALEAFTEASQFGRFCALVGESGSGKSTLRELFEERAKALKIQVIKPYVTDMSNADGKGRLLKSSQIHEAIIRKLAPGQRIPQTPEAKQSRSHCLLMESSAAGYRNVLVFEEAHDLPTQTLKHLKRFWELKDGLKRVFGILLIGQPELSTRLTVRMSWETREIAQRCALTILEPFDTAEIGHYLALKLARVGAESTTLFEPDAYEAIAAKLVRRQTQGRGQSNAISEAYPLAINNLVTQALNLCARIGIPTVGGEQITAAVGEI